MTLKKFSERSIFVLLLQIISLAAAYFVTGKLGTLLAIPPGYATILFPASGIALACILLCGNRVFSGVLIGSFLLNLSTSTITNDFINNLNLVGITFLIACGSTVQAIVGAYLVRIFVGFPQEFADAKNVLLFLFYGGIVSALVNSTLSVSLLVVTGQIPTVDFFVNWLTWWGGDALGIMIFTPVFLVWISGFASFHGRRLAITLPILVMFAITVVAVFYEITSSNERVKIAFEKNTEAMSFELNNSLTANLNVLRSLYSFYAASKTVSSKDFSTFVTHSLDDFKGVQALGYNHRVLASEREVFEKNMRLEGYSNFKITEHDADKKLVPAGNRPEYYPVAIIEPFKGNEKAVGYDINSETIRHEAIERAIDTDALTLTAKIILVQEKNKQNGFLAFIPVYNHNLPHETIEERRIAISGLVTAVLRGNDIIKAALDSHNLAEFSYRLVDVTTTGTEDLIYASNEKEFVPFVLQRKSFLSEEQSLIYSTILPIGGRTWRFDVVPTPNYFIKNRSANAWLILLGGIVLTVLTSVVSLVSSGHLRKRKELLDDAIITNRQLALKSAEAEAWISEFSMSNAQLAKVNEELSLQNAELALAYQRNESLYQQVNQMQKLESIGRLTSGIAHDFNNILACMLGYNGMNEYISEDISDETLKTELANNTKQINDAGQRAVSLIEKMMAYCRQEPKEGKIDVKPTQGVIKEVLAMLLPALTSRIQLEFIDDCHVDHECNTCEIRTSCEMSDIQIDAIDLHQILTNLAVNARDAMKENGGKISVSLNVVTIENRHCLACILPVNGSFIELSVSDNGTGIEEAIINRIFDPFFTTKQQGEGTGLGLSAVSGMVHRASGHILIDSNLTEPNRGTTFRLLFPLVSNK